MYQEKYYHTYCDRYGDIYKVSLQEWNFSGTPTAIECGAEQFIIERETSEAILKGSVFPTRATATFISEGAFELQDLYAGDDKTYLLVRYKNGALNWQGNIIADGFSQSNWDAHRMHLTVKATDNLASLKSAPFVDPVGENYGNDGVNIRSFLWAIKEALKKTGFNMNIWSFLDLKPISQSGSRVLSNSMSRGNDTRIIFYFDTIQQAQEFETYLLIGYKIKFTEGDLAGNQYTITSVTGFYDSVEKLVSVGVDSVLPIFNTRRNAVFEITPPASTTDVDPLYYTEHDVRVWIRDSDIEGKTYYEARGGAMDTWSVLDAIARQWNVIIQQNNGHWEIKRINADKLPAGDFEWFIYNSEGTPIGRQPFGEDVLLPCRPTNQNYRIFGSILSMDRVFKNVIVNYQYKYKQDGDSLLNLVDNPNFQGGHAGWTKIMWDNNTPAISATPFTGVIPPTGINTAITITNRYNAQYLANRSLKTTANPIRQVNKGDKISISWWERITGVVPLEDNVGGVFQISLWGYQTYEQSRAISSSIYSLGLNGINRPEVKEINGVNTLDQKYTAMWQKKEGREDSEVRFTSIMQERSGLGKGTWRKITLDIDEVPANGWIVFEIYGATAFYANNSIPFYMRPFVEASKIKTRGLVRIEGGDTLRSAVQDVITWFVPVPSAPVLSLDITGVQINKIIDVDNEVVPQIDPFMYPDYQAQLSRRYSDTISEIDVLTGDDYDQYADDRISGMSWSGQPTSFWDTWDNRYGWSRQGLVTAKSVIELYWEPTRLLQCEIGMQGLHWSSRIQFEELPGLRFVILRGSIGGQDSTFKGVLKQVHDNAEIALPPGGDDGGNTVEPNWQPTGTSRCIRNDAGLNTGEVERVEVDANPASVTYGQERWVNIGENTETCPIGDPVDIFWGEQSVLDVNNLRLYPYGKDDDSYTVSYSNDNSDVYLRLLHRSSLGTVRSILYENGDESISGWEYDPDVVVDGYTYKSLRLTWFVGVFSNLNVNFVIN